MELKPNKTYALYFSETLEEFDADIDDSIESQGETTVYPSGDEWLQNPLGEHQGSSLKLKKISKAL